MREDRKKRIVIHDGVVDIEETRITKTMSHKVFFENLSNTLGIDTGITPPGTVYYSTGADKSKIIVIENNPGIKKFKLKKDHLAIGKPIDYKKKYYSYNLALPYTYYIIKINEANSIDSVGTFVTKSPIMTMDDYIYAPPVPNLFDSHKRNYFCLGDIRIRLTDQDGAPLPLRLVIQEIIAGLMGSVSNKDTSITPPLEVYNEMLNMSKKALLWNSSRTLTIVDVEPIGALTDTTQALELYFKVWELLSEDTFSALLWKYRRVSTFKEFVDNLAVDSSLEGTDIWE